MLKKIIMYIVITTLCLSLAGCAENKQALDHEITELKSEINQLTSQRDALKTEISDIKVENGTAKYIITFVVKQSHLTTDVSEYTTEYMKDIMNAFTIQIPVDKEYYDSVEVGDTIVNKFRVGSYVLKGSFGSWEIIVEDKEIL
ncbi:MAG: hypothetical protein ACI4GD_08910 [Lachnospiraceae bacterium]